MASAVDSSRRGHKKSHPGEDGLQIGYNQCIQICLQIPTREEPYRFVPERTLQAMVQDQEVSKSPATLVHLLRTYLDSEI